MLQQNSLTCRLIEHLTKMLLLIFETGLLYAAQASLDLVFLLLLPPMCWDYVEVFLVQEITRLVKRETIICYLL